MFGYKLLNHDGEKRTHLRLFIGLFIITSCSLLYYLFYDQDFAVTGISIISFQLNYSTNIEPDHSTSVEQNYSVPEKGPKVESDRFIEISSGNYAFLAIVDQRNRKSVPSNVFPAPKKPQTILEMFQKGRDGGSFVARTSGDLSSPQVRVLMAVSQTSGYSCQFGNGAKVSGKMYQLNENHGKKLKVYYLNCIPPNDVALGNIDKITVIHDSAKKSAVVPISYKIGDEYNMTNFKQTFAICVPFLFGDTYTGKHFVEFMEMNRLLGVEQISIYTNDSMNADLKRVMDRYAEEGLLEMIPISFPVDPSNLWSYGQLLTITDCILRHTGRTQFLALHDLDEYAITKSQNPNAPSPNRVTLVPQLFSNTKIATLRLKVNYLIPNEKDLPITFNSHQRLDYLDDRATKCIVRPSYIFAQGIHYTFRVSQDAYSIGYADEKQMSLFHYKPKELAMERIEGRFGKIKTPKIAEDKYFMDHFANFSQIFADKCSQLGL